MFEESSHAMHYQRFSSLFAAFLIAVVAGAGITAAPVSAQTRTAEQGGAVLVHGTGICTLGYNDPARHRSFVAAHCGADGARVELVGANGVRSGVVGTLHRSKAYDNRLGNDWAAIQWAPGVRVGGNRISGDAWVHPNDIRMGETVCYFGRTSHARGGRTCGKFGGSADNTFFVNAPLTRPGDSGGPLWVPGRGFVGVISSTWTSNPLPGVRNVNFVVGVVPHDGPAVPEVRLVGLWAQNAFLPGLTGPVAEVVRKIFDAVFGLFGSLGFRGPSALRYL